MKELEPTPRLPVVGVMGSASAPHETKAVSLGRALAKMGAHLLTGGGGGVMEAVSRAFHEVRPRDGRVIGVLPGKTGPAGYEPFPGYPNPWVEIPIRTHLHLRGEQGTEPFSRNHINVLSADVVVALPGSAGTASEVRLALRYHKPVVAFLEAGDGIPGLPPGVPAVSTLEEVLAFVKRCAGEPFAL